MLTLGTTAPIRRTHDEPKRVGNPFMPVLVPVESPAPAREPVPAPRVPVPA